MSETTETTETPKSESGFASRRQFIQLGIAAVGAAWAGTLAQAKLFPQASAQEAQPIEFSLADLPVGGVKYITYGGVPAIVTRSAESIRAFSLVCTHLGCILEWRNGEKEFFCACHDGKFDQFGDVIAGPPPVPMEQFPVTVQDETVIVGEV